MAPRSPKRKGALQAAKEYLRINPSASNAKVVEDLSVSLATVSAARSFLVQTGQISRSFYDRSSPALEPPAEPAPGPIVVTGVDDLEKTFAAREAVADASHGGAGEPLTPEEQRQRLSNLARQASLTGNFQLEIAAIQALARLDAQIGARDRLGPGPPLTDEDKIHRLSLLIEACGKRITRKAWRKAFGVELTAENQASASENPSSLGGSPDAGPESPHVAGASDLPPPENAGEGDRGGSGAGNADAGSDSGEEGS
jgi:hypothetical protein